MHFCIKARGACPQIIRDARTRSLKLYRDKFTAQRDQSDDDGDRDLARSRAACN